MFHVHVSYGCYRDYIVCDFKIFVIDKVFIYYIYLWDLSLSMNFCVMKFIIRYFRYYSERNYELWKLMITENLKMQLKKK